MTETDPQIEECRRLIESSGADLDSDEDIVNRLHEVYSR